MAITILNETRPGAPTLQNAVASGSQDIKDAWGYAQEFKRLDPLVLSLGAALGVNDEGLDNLFNLAATL